MLWIPDCDFSEDPRPGLAARLGDPPVVTAAQLARVPVVVTAAYLDRLRDLTRVLEAALRAVVARYFDDPRIRAIYALPEGMEALLRLAADKPYHVGFHRPDFIYDLAGRPRICEIGARYPLNGWMLSQRANEEYAPHATGIGLTAQDAPFLDALCGGYRAGETVAMVHAGEPGTEIFLIAEALRARGVAFLRVHPSMLGLEQGRLHARGRAIDHCILEMDRSELALIRGEALRHLVERGAYFNDIRTLILVHDKRVLAVLWDEAILRDLIAEADAALLRAFLIPSWTIGDAGGCEALLARGEDMVAKRSSGGRGIDALVRSGCGEARWHARVRGEWAQDMYQEYLPQRGFRSPHGAEPIHLVGMQLCRDDTSYGAGVFRGSDAKIINVHGERGHVYVPLVAP